MASDDKYRVFTKPEGKRPLERPRKRGRKLLRLFFKVIGCEQVDWIKLTQDRLTWLALMNTVVIFRIHKNNLLNS
jgi:hypothetical protein